MIKCGRYKCAARFLDSMKKIIIIGGGAAGMMAAIAAADQGAEVTILEKNEKLGKKIFITGKGRCNLTNDCDRDTFFANVVRNPKFLYKAFADYSVNDVLDFFINEGLEIKTERGNRVFPVSDHSSDVIKTLERALKKRRVDVELYTEVESLIVNDSVINGVVLKSGKKLFCDSVIVATGGISYVTTGSTGDGMQFASATGHNVVDCHPALVPFETAEEYITSMQGLALKNVEFAVFEGRENGKLLYKEFGELLFTHFGISGPVVLSAASVLAGELPISGKRLSEDPILHAKIDLKPALSTEKLDEKILREVKDTPKKSVSTMVGSYLPSSMRPVFDKLLGFDTSKNISDLSKSERKNIIKLLKGFPMTLTATRGYNEAIITCGGVSVKDINPSTMESKKIKNLYFAGETIDVDAFTGGFNLQIAWSTGHLAGKMAGGF